VADASEIRHRREGTGLATAFLQWHLERGVRSLRLVERRDPVAPPQAQQHPPLRVGALGSQA